MPHPSSHIPVLTNQVIGYLATRSDIVYIDCTLGAGGHTKALLEHLGSATVYGIDMDERNLEIAKKNLSGWNSVTFIHDSFQNLENIASHIIEKEGRIDAILFDLGLSSMHVDEAERGFSLLKEGPLDMRFDQREPITAATIVNSYKEQDLVHIFSLYGQERFSKRIARAIYEERKRNKFTTTTQLANCIAAAVPRQFSGPAARIHPATRVFQALRIATNREVEALEIGLAAAIKYISPGGRIAVISYHSLEDRIVKNQFRDAARNDVLTLLTKKPQGPEETEIKENPRSRSAKLRVAEKVQQ